MPFSPKQLRDYRKTKKGWINMIYYSMSRRVKGKCNPRHVKLYLGLPILSKKEFEDFIEKSDFERVHKNWKLSGYKRNMSPSINRINNKTFFFLLRF